MLPSSVASKAREIDDLVEELDPAVPYSTPTIQYIIANHLALAAAGYVESSTAEILSEYGEKFGDQRVSNYIKSTVRLNNSLNCNKIRVILNNFDSSWWPSIEGITESDAKNSVDSLKAIRDQISHGRYNGTGYETVISYYKGSKSFVNNMATIILS